MGITSLSRDPYAKAMAALDVEMYRAQEISLMTGRTKRAVMLLGDRYPEYQPQFAIEVGKQIVHLYTPEQVEAIKKHFEEDPRARSGRPALWTLSEAEDRDRRSELARYYTRRAERATDPEVAEQARMKAREIRAGLDRQHALRTEPDV